MLISDFGFIQRAAKGRLWGQWAKVCWSWKGMITMTNAQQVQSQKPHWLCVHVSICICVLVFFVHEKSTLIVIISGGRLTHKQSLPSSHSFTNMAQHLGCGLFAKVCVNLNRQSRSANISYTTIMPFTALLLELHLQHQKASYTHKHTHKTVFS